MRWGIFFAASVLLVLAFNAKASTCPAGEILDKFGACCPESERGCDEVCYSMKVEDSCRVCGGNNEDLDARGACCPESQRSCRDLCNDADTVEDGCGICGGNNITLDAAGNCCPLEVRGCDDLCETEHPKDNCGVCDGDNTSCCGPDAACSSQGVCAPGGCVCEPEWTGAICDFRRATCNYDNCQHGTCETVNGSPVCTCYENWYGRFCQIKDCGNHGLFDYHTKSCSCFSPYTGGDCDGCESPKANHTRVCVEMLSHPGFFPFEVRDKYLDSVLSGNYQDPSFANREVFLAGTVYNGVEYDCGCSLIENDPAARYEDGHLVRSSFAASRSEESRAVYERMLEASEDNGDTRVRWAVGAALYVFLISGATMISFFIFMAFTSGGKTLSKNA